MFRYAIVFATVIVIGLLNPLAIHLLFPGIVGKVTVAFFLAFDALLIVFIYWLLRRKPTDADLALSLFSVAVTVIVANTLANSILRTEDVPLISNLSSAAFDDSERQYLSELLRKCGREYTYSYKKQYFMNAPKNWNCDNFSSEQFETGFFVRSTVSGQIDSRPIRIWIFGASTLYSALSPDDKTIPSYISMHLKNKGISNQVTNFGVPAVDIAQELSNFVTLLQEAKQKPDYVLFYDGGVDSVVRLAHNGEQINVKLTNGVPIVFHGFQSAFYFFSEWISSYSELYRALWDQKLRLGFYAKGLGETTYTPDLAADGYLKAQHVAQIILKGEGIKGYFLLQPMPFSRKMPVGAEAQHAVTELSDQGREVYKLIRDTNSRNPMFRDLSNIFDSKSEQYFWDDSHLGPKGNKVIGEAIGNILMADIKADANSLKGKKQVTH